MKAIFVESNNGYLAKHAEDNMDWTPIFDKKIFKLLTCTFGGVCVCSKNTYMLLPKAMTQDENRKFIIAERAGIKSLYNLNRAYPDAVLIGGPQFLKAAYDLKVIDMFIVTTTDCSIHNNPKYKNPFIDILLKLDMSCAIKFPEMTVRVYKNEYKY